MKLKSVGAALGAGALLCGGVAAAGLAGGYSVHGYTISTGTTGTITVPTTPTTPTVPTTTIPPSPHDCVFTGAGKDGQPGNDDCAPLPKPTVVVEAGTSQVVCPPALVVTQTVTVTRTVQGPVRVQTKVINHVKTRTVYRTRYVTRIKKIYVPGMHKHGVEGSG